MIRIRRGRRRLPSAEEALASADDLAGSDAWLEAIRLLTEANRVQRDGRVERRLVELRFDGFRRSTWPSERPILPEGVEDLSPGTLIPEVRREGLTVESVRSAIQNHGSLLVRGLVGRDQVARLITDIDSAFDAFDARAHSVQRGDVARWYVPAEMRGLKDDERANKRKHGVIIAVESPPTLFDLIDVLNEVGVGELAQEYFGEAPAILARKVTLRRMPHNATGVWHQDGAFMGADIRSLNIWLALTHCGDDAPSLDIVGRRLDGIVPPNGASKAYGITAEAVERVGGGAIVRPIFEPGDALIFDHMCLHRTGRDASMTNGRYAIETWLMAPSTYSAMTSRVESGLQPDDKFPILF